MHRMCERKRIVFGIAALTALILTGGMLYGQGARGAITGFVTDPSGAAAVGATVMTTNSETNVRTTSKTNEAGLYDIGYLDPGIYEVKVTLTGFRSIVRSAVEIQV